MTVLTVGIPYLKPIFQISAANGKHPLLYQQATRLQPGHHYSTKLRSDSVKTVEFFVANGISKCFLSVWKDFADIFSVEMVYPDGFSSGIISLENQIRNIRVGNSVMTVIYRQPSHYSVRQEISFNIQSANGSIPSGLKLRFVTASIVNGKIEMVAADGGRGYFQYSFY